MDFSVRCIVIALGILTVSVEGFYGALDKFGIVEPFPDNIYPIESTSAQVTCVAFDSTGIKTPERIEFMRKDNFARYTFITANDNIYFTNRTEEVDKGGKKLKKLIVTMHIRNVTLEHDSTYGQLGRFECHAFAVGSPLERRHGFSVNVIERSEIPVVSVTKVNMLQHGDSITIFCNMTDTQNYGTVLKRISWLKNGVVQQSVRNPDPDYPADTLAPLVIKNAAARDGGNYSCELELWLRNIKPYNVSDSTMITIAPWFDKPQEDTDLNKFKEESVSFQCAAKGFPLDVEWKFQKSGEDNIRSCISGSDAKYRIHRDGIYAPYVLTVNDLQYSDSGSYYCCLPSNCSNDLKNNCQRFVLGVRDDKFRCKLDLGLLVDMTESTSSPAKGKGAQLVVTATGPKSKLQRGLRGVVNDHAYHVSNYTELNDLFDDLAKVICQPVDGGFSKWTPFSACSVTCGSGVKVRTRTCTNPPRQWKGKDCVGIRQESMACNEGPCK
ncbi:uncharacterized protein [Porites lutea]